MQKEVMETRTAAKPDRKYFAAGDYVTRFPPGNAHEVLIDSPYEKQGWNARAAQTALRAVFPGTAILIEGECYEIIRSERASGEKIRYLYYLKPWQESFAIRLQFAYTREECEKAAAAVAQERKDSGMRLLLLILSPFVGLLPAQDQLKLQHEYGINALRCTVLSTILMLMVGAFFAFTTLIAMFAPESIQTWPVIGSLSPLMIALCAIAFCGESAMRLISIRHDEPAGSFIVCGPIELFRSIRRSQDPASRRQKFEAMESGKASAFLNARDEIRELNETDLEVVSILPKPDWGVATGISFKDAWYGCIETGKVPGEEIRYRFVLRKAPPGAIFRTTSYYTEDDVRNRYRAKRRQDLGTWVETFAPFWGLLEGAEQKQLQQIYGFKALKYTSWTIAALLVVGSANVMTSIFNMSAGIGTAADAIWLLGAGYLVLENVLRLQQWLKQEPSGSVLGILLRPLASILLKA